MLRNGVEPDLGPPEHPEGMGGPDYSPGDIDEPLARRAVDVWPSEIHHRGWGDDTATKFPNHRGDVGRNWTQQILLAFAALYRHVDVVMTVGKIRSGAAATAGQINAFYPYQHSAIVAREGVGLLGDRRSESGVPSIHDWSDSCVFHSAGTGTLHCDRRVVND